jgi:Asp-tRNA(Asn)/Glu-tRNA(Gln) amidotransferase A subunit family amidase
LSRNPYNRAFGSGGSSGGEGGAISTRCAAFGISSDTAGSSRIPASFCGNFGFKPTGGKRLSTKGRLGVSGRPVIFKNIFRA